VAETFLVCVACLFADDLSLSTGQSFLFGEHSGKEKKTLAREQASFLLSSKLAIQKFFVLG
jgi:hypothetical protein